MKRTICWCYNSLLRAMLTSVIRVFLQFVISCQIMAGSCQYWYSMLRPIECQSWQDPAMIWQEITNCRKTRLAMALAKLENAKYIHYARVLFSMGYGPRCQAVSCYLMTNSKISIGEMAPWVFYFFKFNTILSSNI